MGSNHRQSFYPKRRDDVVKHPKDCMGDETKKDLSDLKARKILISTLRVKVLYSISHHKSAKTMWDALETLYKGTGVVEDSKINMLTK